MYVATMISGQSRDSCVNTDPRQREFQFPIVRCGKERENFPGYFELMGLCRESMTATSAFDVSWNYHTLNVVICE